jgi:hypothetical protein
MIWLQNLYDDLLCRRLDNFTNETLLSVVAGVVIPGFPGLL